MKKIWMLGLLLCNITFLTAQNITDGVRYASENLVGTARFVAMGGAFTSLGGDLSAIKINPASSGVFLSNQAAISLKVNAYKNATDYINGHDDYRNNGFNLNQAGAVFVFNNYDENASLNRFSFGVTYDQDNSFNNRYRATGTSDETIGDYFLNLANGIPLDLFTLQSGESLSDLYAYLGYGNEGFGNTRMQTAYLGYEAILFDPNNPDDLENTGYYSNISGDSFNHFYERYEKGMNGKVSFNGGFALNDQFYFGLNLNSHFIDFRQTIILNEQIPGNGSIREVNFGNWLDTKGDGFSMQVGGIARLGDMFRVGLSYESPTWYKITEETNQVLRSVHAEHGELYVDPRITNVFPAYSYRTPGKVNVGVSSVFGDKGLISIDYSYKDFSNTKFSSRGFGEVNRDIKDKLQAVSTFRAGGEYRIKDLSLRAGFRYEDTPYKDKTIGELKGYSAGLGYNFGGLQIDFAYDISKRAYDEKLLYTGFDQKASVKNTLSNYVLTFAFPF